MLIINNSKGFQALSLEGSLPKNACKDTIIFSNRYYFIENLTASRHNIFVSGCQKSEKNGKNSAFRRL